MAATASGRAFKSKEWMKAHPFIGGAATGLLGFLMGVGAATGDKAGLEARLSAAKARARSAESSSSGEIHDLTSSQKRLQQENDQLSAQNARLHDQVVKLNAKREMPDLVGMSDDAAARVATKYGWVLHTDVRYSTAEAGTVLSQSPSPGTMMRYKAPVKLVVAKAIPKVPSLVGMAKNAAIKAARSAGYDVVVVEQISTQKPGTVLAMTPGAGSRLVPGQTVTLTIAKKAPPAPEVEAASTDSCDYDPCLAPASDYDCLGGSGDGPKYTGMVRVIGYDIYDLDADGDGIGCE